MFAFTGCEFEALHEIDYNTVLVGWPEPNEAMVVNFATDLAKDCDLRALKPHGDGSNVGVELTAQKVDPDFYGHIQVAVYIGLDTKTRTFFVEIPTIPREIKAPTPEDIAKKTEIVFARDFPGEKLTRFIRHEGLMGP